MANPDVVLITKADCHLCAAARDAVGRVTAALGLGWTEQSVDSDDGLRDRYAEEIPVVLVDGIQRDFWKIDEARLERVLRQAHGAASQPDASAHDTGFVDISDGDLEWTHNATQWSR